MDHLDFILKDIGLTSLQKAALKVKIKFYKQTKCKEQIRACEKALATKSIDDFNYSQNIFSDVKIVDD